MSNSASRRSSQESSSSEASTLASPGDHPIALPDKMRAWTYSQAGSPLSVLHLALHPVPKPPNRRHTEVLVHITHCSLLPRCSYHKPRGIAIPELDFAGTIVEVSPRVEPERRLTPGTKVFGSILMIHHLLTGAGALAECVVVDAYCVVPLPSNCTLLEAAALGVSGCAALELLDKSSIRRGQRILIHDAAGPVGLLLVQLVRARVKPHGWVVGVCSEADREYVKDLGAHRVITQDTISKPLHEHLKSCYGKSTGKWFDNVIDAGGDRKNFIHCAKYLKLAGQFTTVRLVPKSDKHRGAVHSWLSMSKNVLLPRKMRKIEKIADSGREKNFEACVNGFRDMEHVLEAYAAMLNDQKCGKVVIKIQDDLPEEIYRTGYFTDASNPDYRQSMRRSSEASD